MSDVATRAPRSAGPATLWGFLDIGLRRGDDADLRARKRATVGTILATIGAAFAYLALGISADRPGITVFAILQLMLQASLLIYFARTGRLAPVAVIVLVAGLLVVGSGVVAFGGMQQSNGNLVLAVLVPMGAGLLLGRRAAVLAFLGTATLILLSALSDAALRSTLSPISPALGVALYAMNLLVAGGIALGLVLFIDGERLAAKARSEALLLNVLPEAIVERLQGGEKVIADHCPEVTVLFSDVVDFTPWSERTAPERVVEVLDNLFSAFDILAERYGLEKIKTIGDAYMVVSGVPETRPDHAEVMVEMAIAMHRAADELPPLEDHRLQIRTGIASGPVVAGVIGRQKFSYDLWGDTVNTASRMESSGVPGSIQVTMATWQRVKDRYRWQVREGVEVKGKGPMTTYLLDPATLGASS